MRFLAHDNALDLGVISHTFRAASAAASAAAERVGALPLSAAERAAAARFAALPRRLRGGGLPEEAAAAEGGGLREWGGAAAARPEADLGHRHFSHLYALFPGEDVGPVDTPRLARAARRALERRLHHGGGHTGWSAAWAAALWARLHEGGAAHAAVRVLLHEFSSTALLGLHPPLSPAQADNGGGRCATCVKRRGGAREGIFQLDANAGAAAGSNSAPWQRQRQGRGRPHARARAALALVHGGLMGSRAELRPSLALAVPPQGTVERSVGLTAFGHPGATAAVAEMLLQVILRAWHAHVYAWCIVRCIRGACAVHVRCMPLQSHATAVARARLLAPLAPRAAAPLARRRCERVTRAWPAARRLAVGGWKADRGARECGAARTAAAARRASPIAAGALLRAAHLRR